MLNIVYSLPHPADRLSSAGAGHVVRAASLVSALRNLGHHVTVVEAAQLPGGSSTVRGYRNAANGRIPRRILRPVRDVGRVAFGLRAGHQLADIVTEIQPDVILETHIAFSLCGAIASARSGVPLVLDDVAPAWEEELLYGIGTPRLARRVYRRVVRQATLVIAVNGSIRKLLADEIGTATDGVAVVENGFDPAPFAAAKEAPPPVQLRRASGDVVLVFAGSFQPYHRVDLLIHAVASLGRPVQLALVGDGHERDSCRRLADELGVQDRVAFIGSVPHDEVPRWLVHSDVGVLPASNHYGNPMKLYEYLAAGLPVVAPDLPQVRDIVDGDVAVLFRPDGLEPLRDALATVVEEHDLRRRMAAEAARRAEGMSWSTRAQQLVEAMTAAGIGT